ncbi:MAG: radical SAM protein [Promethearchaeota archaeon]
MSDALAKLERAEAAGADGHDWEDLRPVLEFTEGELARVQEVTSRIRDRLTGMKVKLYYPGRDFPSISVTGEQCSLECAHCNKKYLRGMIPAVTPGDLLEKCRELERRGSVGCLISGGCDSGGAVPLEPFLETIRQVKEETGLVLNVHTGLLTEGVARGLAAAGIDAVSFDVNLDPEVIGGVYHLDASPDDYKNAMDLLVGNGVPVVPHICVGLNGGRLGMELEALRFVHDYPVDGLVFIVLIPPKNTPTSSMFVEPDPLDLGRVVAAARLQFREADISLGCMRPKTRGKRLEYERQAVLSGANQLVLPAPTTVEWLEGRGYETERYNACCAVGVGTSK